MDREILIQGLDANEIDILLQLYYLKEGLVDKLFPSEVEKETLQHLADKHLVNTTFSTDKNIVTLTDQGIMICGSVMYNRVQENNTMFNEKMQALPERAVACLVNRILWQDEPAKEKGFLDIYTISYTLDQKLWYERVLLKDERMKDVLGRFHTVLESLEFVKTVGDQWWCSPEVEEFLRTEYKDNGVLSWIEEDSLKYYFFFYIYAHDQKNLIDFTGKGEAYRPMFFGDDNSPPDYWFSSNRSDSTKLLSKLGVSEKRILGFFEDIKRKNIVNERYYPLSSFSFFSEDDKIFVIQDIQGYMDFITNKFLTPVVDSLVETS